MNRTILDIPKSVTLTISARAKAFAAAGEDVCTFGAGEPDFDTPQHIKDAAAKALAEGRTKYEASQGLAALREAVAEKLTRENGLDYSANQVVVSNGAKHSLFNVMLVLCSPGDEVILPEPYWLSYPEMVRVAGGKTVAVATREQDSYKMSPEQLESAITRRSVAVVINSPSNPTGAVYTRSELAALAQVALRHKLYIISDEIYEKILYDDTTHVSIGSLSPEILARTITVNGFSKAYAMTGWRLGYIAAPADVAEAAIRLQSHSTSGANTFAQYGALAALTGAQDCVAHMVAEFAKRRRYLHGRLSELDGVTCLKPMGAFYMFPTISSFGLGSEEFAARLLEAQKVAVVPGKPFGADQSVRFSYACAMANIERGIDRLGDFIATLQ